MKVDRKPRTAEATVTAFAGMARQSAFYAIVPMREKTLTKTVGSTADVNAGARTYERLMEAFARHIGGLGNDLHEIYTDALKLTEGVSYSRGDVLEFSRGLTPFQNINGFGTAAGVFLSALVNNCPDRSPADGQLSLWPRPRVVQSFWIFTSHLDTPIDFIGYRNKKLVKVRGPVGSMTGHNMLAGRLIIDGAAGAWTGDGMEGGELIALGSVDTGFGWENNGGTLVANGPALDLVAGRMKSGTVQLRDGYVALGSETRGGDVYHRGVKLIENGERTWQYWRRHWRASWKDALWAKLSRNTRSN